MVNIGIPEKNRQEVAHKMNLILSNEFVLYVKTLNYHWNVVGKDFREYHKLFEDQYETILDMIDAIAERIRTLGFPTFNSMTEYLKHATVREQPGQLPDDLGMITHLLTDHETIIRQLREAIDFAMDQGDVGTNNFLTEKLEIHEKIAWMLRSHVTV